MRTLPPQIAKAPLITIELSVDKLSKPLLIISESLTLTKRRLSYELTRRSQISYLRLSRSVVVGVSHTLVSLTHSCESHTCFTHSLLPPFLSHSLPPLAGRLSLTLSLTDSLTPTPTSHTDQSPCDNQTKWQVEAPNYLPSDLISCFGALYVISPLVR